MGNITTQLDFIDSISEDIVTIDPRDLYTLLPKPTLIKFKGKNKGDPLFISTLLHGNETTGFYALQRILKKYVFGDQKCPRDLIVFIGNVDAARHYQRHLETQPDYNRIWSGEGLTQHPFAQQLLDYLKNRKLFACIDIHNNTGANPFYGCVNNLNPETLHLAKRFSNEVVYFTQPEEALSVALSQLTTTVILESGRSNEIAGIERTTNFLEDILFLDKLETTPLNDNDIHVFHSVGKILIPDAASISFNKQNNFKTDFTFLENIEYFNFKELPEHTLIGWSNTSKYAIQVLNEEKVDIGHEIFSYDNNEIRTKRPVIPSMLCTSEKIIRQDVLGYIMHRYTIS